MIRGPISEIEESLPNGFHDAELFSFEVKWPDQEAVFKGLVDVSVEGQTEESRPFELVVHGLSSLLLPLAFGDDENGPATSVSLVGRGWCGGLNGWPPGREPRQPPPEPLVYSFFLHQLNDFITVQGTSATFEWAGTARER